MKKKKTSEERKNILAFGETLSFRLGGEQTEGV
jgi:hypothetical protein